MLIVTGTTCEVATHSGTPDFTPFGAFIISPIYYNYMHYRYVSRGTMFTD